MEENPLYDEELLKTLLELREKDFDGFMNLVLSSLKKHPEVALEDRAPVESKLKALTSMLKHYEENESYEDCAFLRDLKESIENEKNKVRGNKR